MRTLVDGEREEIGLAGRGSIQTPTAAGYGLGELFCLLLAAQRTYACAAIRRAFGLEIVEEFFAMGFLGRLILPREHDGAAGEAVAIGVEATLSLPASVTGPVERRELARLIATRELSGFSFCDIRVPSLYRNHSPTNTSRDSGREVIWRQ
jgi:hypothetical protein